MKGTRCIISIGILGVCGLMAAGRAEAADEGSYLGPCALSASPDAKKLYVACADAESILVVDLTEEKVTRQVPMPARPTGMALSGDGSKLYVTCAAPQSTVVVLQTESLSVAARIPVGHTACGPALSPDGLRLYVCNRFDNDVSVVDLDAGVERERVPAVREPIAAAATPDGRSVLVANHLPADRADQFYTSPVVTVIDTQTHATTAIRLPNGSVGVREMALSPDGRFAFLTHTLGNYELVPSQVDAGWTNTNVISIVDTMEKRRINTISLDDLYLGAGNPWGIACTADGQSLCVSHAGSRELSIVDLPEMLDRLGTRSATLGGTPINQTTLAGVRRRIELPSFGPRGLAVVGSTVYVAGYFSDTLDVVELASQGEDSCRTIRLGPKPNWTARRRGEMLFHDATLCYQHWHSCSSCHPDARTDTLNWDLRNDGVGNAKNTKSMLLAHRTPPAMASGVRPSAEVAVRSGIEHILFAEVREDQATAIDEYLGTLQPVVSPHLVGGQLSEAALRGKALFESREVGCSRCHPAPLFTDQLMHDVGSRGTYETRNRFDTPTLIEAWRTAPYMHNGRYTTIEEVLLEGAHGAKAGSRKELSPQQIQDIATFVRSL